MSQVWLMRPVMPVPGAAAEDGDGGARGFAHVLLGQDLDEVDHGIRAFDLDHLPGRSGQEEAAQEGQARGP